MITVTWIAGTGHIVNMDFPELHVIRQVSAAFGISQEDAMVAVINRGMDSIAKQIQKVDANKKFGPLTHESDEGGD